MSGMMGPGLALFRDLEDKLQRTAPRWVPDRFLSMAFVVPLKLVVKESSRLPFSRVVAKAGMVAVMKSGSRALLPQARIRVPGPGGSFIGEVGPPSSSVAVPRHKPLAPAVGWCHSSRHHLQDMTRRNISLAEMNI